jgi:alpha-beta hydrolase superfamily lysophospholipase
MEDLKEIVIYLQEKYRMDRYILFGHSMGALITCAFMQNYVEEERYPERVVINAPPCGASGLLGKILKILPPAFFNTACEIPFSVPVGGLVDLDVLSHDPRTKEDYLIDPLNSLKLESKLIFELMKCAQATFARPIRSKCPSFVTVGSADTVVGEADVVEYFTHVDKSFNLKIIDGAYHEIHNEIEKYRKPYFDHLKTVFAEVLFKEKN